jgi:hypothetical protein
MARAIETDPHMNFKFGVRHDERSPWVGFTAVDIVPGVAGSKGVLHLKKRLGHDFIDFLNQVGDRLNIGIFHISEGFPCDNPRFQIDLYGLSRKDMEMGTIRLDAKGGPADQQVLQTDIVMTFDRMVMRDKDSNYESAVVRRQPMVRATTPVIM